MMSETGLPLTETGPPPAGTCRLAPVWVTWISQCSGAISGSFSRTVTSPAEPILFTPWFSSTCECSPLGNTSFMSALLRTRGQALPGAATAAVYPWADTTVTGDAPASLHHTQMGAPGALATALVRTGRRFVRAIRAGQVRLAIVRQHHPLAGFLGVDRQHRRHRHLHRVADAAEAGQEAHAVVVHHQLRDRPWSDVQHDLAVLHRRGRHAHALALGIHQQVRGHAVVVDPLVQRPQQVRTIGAH